MWSERGFAIWENINTCIFYLLRGGVLGVHGRPFCYVCIICVSQVWVWGVAVATPVVHVAQEQKGQSIIVLCCQQGQQPGLCHTHTHTHMGIAKFNISWSSSSSYSPSWAVPALPARCCRALRTYAGRGYQPGSQLGAAEVRFCWRCQCCALSSAYEGIRSTMPGPQQKGWFFFLLRVRKSNYFSG